MTIDRAWPRITSITTPLTINVSINPDTTPLTKSILWSNVLATIIDPVIITQADGINYAPGSDIDCDLVTVDVTGAPTVSWDESDTAFNVTPALNVGIPITDGPHSFSVRGTFADNTMRHVIIRNDAETTGALMGLWVSTADDCHGIMVKHHPLYTGTAGYAGTTQFYGTLDTADHVALGHTAVTGNRCGVGTILGCNTTGGFIRFEIGPTYPASEMMRLTTTGLGIGTHEPVARLEVVKGSGAQLFCLRTQGTITGTGMAAVEGTDYAILAVGVDATQFYLQAGQGAGGTAKTFAIWTAAAQRMCILQTGLVGIGTTAPDTQLEINSATGACLRLTYDDANGTASYKTDFAVSASGDLTITPSGGDCNIAARVGIGAGVASSSVALQVANSIALSNSDEGNTARLTFWTQRELVTLSGATKTTTMLATAGSLLLGASFCVNTAVSDDTADPDTWSAAFSGGSTTALATAAAAAQNTKVDTMIVPEVASATTYITFTPQGGSFDGGVIEVVMYFAQLLSLANA